MNKFILLFLSLFLQSCTVGPEYQQPLIEFMPAKYATSFVSKPNPKPTRLWWEELKDPILNEIISIALKQNIDLEIAKSRILKACARHGYSKADFLPSTTLQASYAHIKLSEQSFAEYILPFFPETINQNQLNMNISWEIDLFGGLRRKNQMNFANLNAEILDKIATEVSLASEIAKTYINFRAIEKKIAINKETTNLLARLVRLNQYRFEAGIDPGTNVSQARALLMQTRANLPALELIQKESEYKLEILTALSPGSLALVLNKTYGLPKLPKLPNPGIPSDLLRLRPDILSAEHRLVAANANIGANQAELFPKFSLLATGGFQALINNPLLSANSIFLAAVPLFSWKILDFWRIDALIKEARGNHQEKLYEYKNTVLKAIHEVQLNIIRYDKYKDAVNYFQENLRAQKTNHRLIHERFDKGLFSFINVIEARRQLYSAEENLVSAQERSIIAFIDLSKSVGGGVICQ